MQPATDSGQRQRAVKEQPSQMFVVQFNNNKTCFLAPDINKYKTIQPVYRRSFLSWRHAKPLVFWQATVSYGMDKLSLHRNTEQLIRVGRNQVKPQEFEFSTLPTMVVMQPR